MNSDLIISSILNGLKPFLPYLILAFIFVLGIQSLKIVLRKKPKRPLPNNTNFEAVRLLNKQEVKVYDALFRNIEEQSQQHYKVFAQVSLGEILRNDNRNAFYKINQKRIDFCIVDADYMPVAAIEYHGGGHFQGNYQERDAIKQQAVENAGLIYHAIYEQHLGFLDQYIQTDILPLLSQPKKQAPKKSTKNERIEPTF